MVRGLKNFTHPLHYTIRAGIVLGKPDRYFLIIKIEEFYCFQEIYEFHHLSYVLLFSSKRIGKAI